MEKYFLAKDGQQTGPFTVEELKAKAIGKEDLVWKEGIENWKRAGEVTELSELFKGLPPPLPVQKISPPPIPIPEVKPQTENTHNNQPVQVTIHQPAVPKSGGSPLLMLMSIIGILGGAGLIVLGNQLSQVGFHVNFDGESYGFAGGRAAQELSPIIMAAGGYYILLSIVGITRAGKR